MPPTEAIAKLTVTSYPDPVLRCTCAEITEFGPRLRLLGDKMLALMKAHRGVGLAAPQVRLSLRLFVCNPTGEPQDDHVFVNPRLDGLEGQEEGDEGCLCFEGVTVKVRRAKTARLVAQTPEGETVRLAGAALPARIWQHEIDHLEGRLIIDYQSPADALANRRALRQLEEKVGQPPARSRRR